MKRTLKLIGILFFVGFVGIQFMRPGRTNPPINERDKIEATGKVPANIAAILNRSCKDCHSNETRYPWYSNIAPISWSVVEHVRVAREKLNYSKWGTYSSSRKKRKIEEICEEVESGHMPHNQYLWIHWEAVLSDSDVNSLCDWTRDYAETIGEN